MSHRAAMPRSRLDEEITAFLERYAAAYNRQDYDALLALWDTDDADAFYMAEEVDPPLEDAVPADFEQWLADRREGR